MQAETREWSKLYSHPLFTGVDKKKTKTKEPVSMLLEDTHPCPHASPVLPSTPHLY